MELLTIVVGSRTIDLAPDRRDAFLNRLGRAGTLDDDGVVAGDLDLLGHPELGEFDLIEIGRDVLHERFAAGEASDVLEHRLATIAVARCFDRCDLQRASELVDDECRECFAGDVLSDDDQWLLRAHDLFKQRDEFGEVINLVFVDEDERLVELDLHAIWIGGEVRREEPAIELHAFDDGDFCIEAFALFNRDHAVLADLVERVGHDLAGLWIVVGRDGRDILDVLLAADRGRHLVDCFGRDLDALLHASDERVGIDASRDVAETFFEQCFSEHGRGGCAIAGVVGGLGGCFFDEHRAHVLGFVEQLDFFSDGYAVLGDGWAAP